MDKIAGTCNALFVKDGKGHRIVIECDNCGTEQGVAGEIGKIHDRIILGICVNCNCVLLYPSHASW